MADSNSPLFIAQETICTYPISTVYNSCPRYLYYALLFASCATRWRGWLADVFLGTAATYAGTAAFQAFILVASRYRTPTPEYVSLPTVPSHSSVSTTFPSIVTGEQEVLVQPAALELDADAVLAIVVTGYLVFLPLQCWSRSLQYKRSKYIVIFLWNLLMLSGAICALIYWPELERSPTQYMFCNPEFPPASSISNDGWQPNLWKSSWNSTVWSLFGNASRWQELESVCFYPCFNTSQVLRQPTALEADVAVDDLSESVQRNLWGKVAYSRGYIYALIAISVALNFLIIVFQFLSYPSQIPSLHASVVWSKRKAIYTGLTRSLSNVFNEPGESLHCETGSKLTRMLRSYKLLHPRYIRRWIYPILDILFLITFALSVLLSPFTVIAFIIWIEWYIYNDGPPQESVQQVGQWSPLVALGLVLISAGIIRLKYKLASTEELDQEIGKVKSQLGKLEALRQRQSAKHSRECNEP